VSLQPKDLTVLIISYYRGDRLRKCIETLHLIPNIIVWDNNTTGEELYKIKQIENDFPHVKFIYSSENVGFSKACNQGFILSDTDWVMFSADDMIFENDWFDILNNILDEKPRLEQIHLNAWNAFVFHKQTVVRMGWWDEGYRYWPTMEDDDWYLRTVEELGYSPYGTWAEHIPFPKEYIEAIKPYVDAKKDLFDREDNFTYYCNSIYSKYKIIGKSTITGQEDDAGSRNTEEGSIDRGNNMTGVEYHHTKWQQVHPMYLKQPGILLGKDGRVWKRKLDELDYYPEVRKEYIKKYFNINL
jgi:glycosyltransferase involved in cell wall biosynthesis